MVASLTNFDDKHVELQVRGNLLNSKGKILLDDQPIARFEGGLWSKYPTNREDRISVTRMTVSPLGTSALSACAPLLLFLTSDAALVDVAMAVTLLVCLQDISTED
jgi:hypothetical protein